MSWPEVLWRCAAVGDAAAAAAHFAVNGHWRDVLAFTWRLQTESGVAAIEAAMAPTLAQTRPTNFHIPVERSAPRRVRRAGTDCMEAIFEFETDFGRANGVVRLVEDPVDGAWRAWDAAHHARGTARLSRRAAAGPERRRALRAISAARTGSTSAARRRPMPITIRPCWWWAAARRGSPSRPCSNALGVDTPSSTATSASATTGACATTRSPCTTKCTSITCR